MRLYGVFSGVERQSEREGARGLKARQRLLHTAFVYIHIPGFCETNA